MGALQQSCSAWTSRPFEFPILMKGEAPRQGVMEGYARTIRHTSPTVHRPWVVAVLVPVPVRVVGLAICQAGLSVLGGGVTPAVRPALPMGRSRQLGELLGEDAPALVDPLLGQVVVRRISCEVALLDQPVQIPDADVGVNPQKALDEGGIGIVAESLAAQP